MKRPLALACLACLLPLASGCSVLGYAAAVIPGPGTKARYAGLAGQKVVIITWVERAVTYDYAALPTDVSMGLQNKLIASAKPEVKMDELKGTTFVDQRQVARWLKNHPELDNRSLQEIAPKAAAALGCTRLIYIELSPFSIYDPRTPVLLKGYGSMAVRVAEVNGSGDAKIGYEEAAVTADFPKSAPEGVPPTDTVTPSYIYKGLVDRITTEVAKRFISTGPDEE